MAIIKGMKKKIIIFTSAGGGGHISATKAIDSYIGHEYDLRPVYIFNEVFKSVDPATILSFGRISGEDIYNFFLKRRWYSILNMMYDVGNRYFGLRAQSMTKIATDYLAHEKPDLVISVIPIVNNIILDAAKANKIPFILSPTDFDVTSFIRDIKNPNYSKFDLTIASNDPLVTQKVAPAHIEPVHIFDTGLPMRSSFFELKDKGALKHEFSISLEKPVIVMMMGGQGNSSIKIFAEQLAQLHLSAHLIICVGKDASLKQQLEKIAFNPSISVTIMGYTERIADLLAISDLLITKSGSVSFAEGIYMNVPMILDATATLLYWERLNHKLLKAHDWGISLTKASELNAAITKILNDKQYHAAIVKRLKDYPKKRLDIELKPIIEKLLA
jgi:processive 1,2-diacylglycerol beta-glucosyltransferase